MTTPTVRPDAAAVAPTPNNLGLALSGGGYRASVFHLGMLARLAESQLLERVSFISTVSGGSLAIGLVMACSGFQWPTSDAFLANVLHAARCKLTTTSLRKALIARQLVRFWTILETRADDVAVLLQDQWGVTAKLADLPNRPRWLINATCAETGKNWRFERFRMGGTGFNYCYQTNRFPVSEALAASAGYPVAIGPLVVKVPDYEWYDADGLQPPAPGAQPRVPHERTVHLWDGGVYDNLGLEPIDRSDLGRGWRKGIDFAVISDAAGRSGAEQYQWGISALQRLFLGIIFDQVRSLRTRMVLRKLAVDGDPGAYIQSGNDCEYVLTRAGLPRPAIEAWMADCLDPQHVAAADQFKTDIDQLSEADFENLFRHGFEVADYTLGGYHPTHFQHVSFASFKAAHPWQGCE